MGAVQAFDASIGKTMHTQPKEWRKLAVDAPWGQTVARQHIAHNRFPGGHLHVLAVV